MHASKAAKKPAAGAKAPDEIEEENDYADDAFVEEENYEDDDFEAWNN